MVKSIKKKKKEFVKPKTRKEIRKSKHLQKKENKRNYFGKNKKQIDLDKSNQRDKSAHNNRNNRKNDKKYEVNDEDVEITSDSDVETIDYKKPAKKPVVPATKPKQKIPTQIDAHEQHRKEIQKKKQFEYEQRKKRKKHLKLANEEDDLIISKLEKKLKLNRSKDKKKSLQKMFSDGLDYALELCLDEDDTKKSKNSKKNSVKSHVSDEESVMSNDDDKSISEYSDFDDNNEEDNEDTENSNESESEMTVKEDIYGRPLNKSENSNVGKYVPPQQRGLLSAAQEKNNVELERLQRTCKGLLNRLSEANMHKIANSVEELYRNNSRFDMNNTLASLIFEALITKTLCNERMVQEYTVLLAYLHAQVGNEIGTHFLQMFIKEFCKLVNDVDNMDTEIKLLNNVILVLSYFYIFKIFQHNLIIEIIDKLTTNLCEKTVECLLLIFQAAGFRFRKDDPVAFKTVVLSIQKTISESSIELKENPRLKYMVDILNAVKNNNISKITQFDPELTENLKKKLKVMLKNDHYVSTLNISIADLQNADEVGKWWVVGSAWSGKMQDINAANRLETNQQKLQKAKFSEKLISLAKEQKMNTDERINIFCILMSAEDYVDAFEKILHLSIKDQRTISSVIIHCCIVEKVFNLYYVFLAQKFCKYDRRYQLAIQFAIWDRINDLQTMEKSKVKKLALFILNLILQGGQPLSILKIVNFANLDKLSFCLVKEIIVGILLAPEADFYQIFDKVSKNTKLNMFKSSIRLFMQHFILNNESNIKLDNEKMVLVKKRIEIVEKILTYVGF